MSDVVALHTQQLLEPMATTYLELLRRGLRAARLNATFPDRGRLDASLAALGSGSHQGLYDRVYIDARTGLPNMASFTRVLADKSVGLEALPSMRTPERTVAGDGTPGEAELIERTTKKRRYYEILAGLELAPVDEHRVFLRRHDPAQAQASFRVELTKLASSGLVIRVVIDLTQTSGLWSHKLIDLDRHGEVASGTEALRAMVYRLAGFDAETLFVRLHELDGVAVERVQRGIVGPVLFALPNSDGSSGAVRIAEPIDDELARSFVQWCRTAVSPGPQLVASFATDIAATDVREDKSNDPLSPLLASAIREQEQARYALLRQRHPFRVFKDRKFVVTAAARPLVDALCKRAGTKNLVYAP